MIFLGQIDRCYQNYFKKTCRTIQYVLCHNNGDICAETIKAVCLIYYCILFVLPFVSTKEINIDQVSWNTQCTAAVLDILLIEIVVPVQ